MSAALPTLTVREWSQRVKSYAEGEGLTVTQAQQYLSERDSLEVAISLMGEVPEDGGDYGMIRDLAASFGAYLEEQGYAVPDLWSNVTNYTQRAQVIRTLDQDRDEWYEKYMHLRAWGMTRSECIEELGISRATLYKYLEKWGITKRAAEVEAMKAWRTQHPSIESKAPETSADVPDTVGEYKRPCTLTITLTEVVIRESINALVDAAMEPEYPDGLTIDAEVMKLLYVAKERGWDIASMLVQRLREAAM